MLIVKDAIGYGTGTQAVFYTDKSAIDGKKFNTPADSLTLNSAQWSYWGDNNDEPANIADDIENCGVLSAGIESETRLAMGKGFDPYLLVDKDQDGNETLEWISDPEINDFLELNNSYQYGYRNIYNQLGYGFGATQFILSKNRKKINRILATDIYTARLEKKQNGYINNMYLCADWTTAPSAFDNDKIKKIKLLTEGYELEQLLNSTTGFEFGILHRLLRNGRGYYPQPLHRSAKAWTAISRSIPAIKNAINKNQMIIKYLIVIADTYWQRVFTNWTNQTPQEREDAMNSKYNDINDFLTGELNAGKSIMAGKYFDPFSKAMVDDITITVIDDKIKDGKMLPDNAAADKQILFSMFFNPAIWGGNLLGDGASGGAGSGSDIREATLVLLMLLHHERMQNLTTFNLIKKYNGWSERLEKPRKKIFAINDPNPPSGGAGIIIPRLVFRYSSSILTTLDTGKSTKPITN